MGMAYFEKGKYHTNTGKITYPVRNY